MHSELLADLALVVDSAGLVPTDEHERYTTDWTRKYSGAALAVLRPASTEQVSAIVERCGRAGVAIVPQGGSTGLCGGAVPVDGSKSKSRPSIVMSLSRMNSIVSIDVDNASITTEAGVTIQALQEATADAGLLFAPDWGARGTAQVGGAISTNAGGLNVLRWGTMREQVLGLEAVLPDGRIWNGLRSLRKDSTGLDLKQLLIGTEGTLGIVTKAVLKLYPLPAANRSALVSLGGLDALLPLLAHFRAVAGSSLSAFELVPEEGIRRVLAKVAQARHPFAETGEWYVLLRLSGSSDVEDTLTTALAGAFEAGLINDAAVAATAEQDENLWLLRDELPAPFTFDERGNRHKFDLAVPLDRVVDFIEAAGPAVDAIVPGTLTYAFGHVGDGNLHFNIYPGPDASIDAFDSRGAELVRAIDEQTHAFGGTISAEHGVGQLMRSRLVAQKSAVEFDVMEAIKLAVDPSNIMNPGKVIPSQAQRVEGAQ